MPCFLADWLDNEDTGTNYDRATKIWQLVGEQGLKVLSFEAVGEDGIFYIYGFVVIDPASKKAIMIHSRTSA